MEFDVFFSISQLFQLVMGYGTFESALRLAPIFVAMIVMAPQAPRFVARFGTRTTVAGGLGVVASLRSQDRRGTSRGGVIALNLVAGACALAIAGAVAFGIYIMANK